MKKLISFLMILAVLASLCACGQTAIDPTEPSTEATEPTEEATQGGFVITDDPEVLYGHIDQTKPDDKGVYKLWNKEGVLNMANVPDGEFEILCDIDMEGQTVSPIGDGATPFTGEIKGGNYTISNFTIAGSGEYFGLVGNNQGTVRNLILDNVTLQPCENAKYIGSLAGYNTGKVARCVVKNAVLTVEKAADGALCGGAAGYNNNDCSNNDVDVDITFTAPGAACVGGLTGVSEGGKLEYSKTTGSLTVTGDNKTCGLFAGKANDIALSECVFVGADNSLNGKLFENYTGVSENVTATGCLVRDNNVEPLTEGQAALRDKVVEIMRQMGTLEWKVEKDLVHTCTCSYSGCYTTYTTKYTYIGLPYNHYCSGLERAQAALDENGYVADWFYEVDSAGGYDMYFGADCSAAIQQAWYAVSNSAVFYRTGGMLPALGLGCLPVGDYEWDLFLEGQGSYTTAYTDIITGATGEQRMFEAYGDIRRGDAIMYQVEAGGHTRMAAEDAVVVRDQDGNISGEHSYVVMHEQGAGYTDEEKGIKTTWRIGYKYTFANLLYDGAIPVTCKELLTGVNDPEECTLTGSADGYAGMFSGVVESNYHLSSVHLKVTDAQGNQVLHKPMYPSVEKGSDYGTYHHKARGLVTEFDLAHVAVYLQDFAFETGVDYTYTIEANLATGGSYLLKEDSFRLGA